MSQRTQSKLFASYQAGLTASAPQRAQLPPGANGVAFEAYEQQLHARGCEDAEAGVRCGCGALLARWVASGLELKCRRCKQTTLIPFPHSLRKTST